LSGVDAWGYLSPKHSYHLYEVPKDVFSVASSSVRVSTLDVAAYCISKYGAD